MKRKNFSRKVDLYPSDKTKLEHDRYSADKLEQTLPKDATIFFPKNSSGRVSYSFSRFYGKECDDIVLSFQEQIQCILETSINTNGKSLSIKTILGYCRGASSFLSYCVLVSSALNKRLTLADVNKSLIIGFIEYLTNSKLKRSSPRAYYKCAKQILIILGKHGRIAKDIFPKNPYPHNNRMLKGETALSTRECNQLSCALKTEIKIILDEYNKELSGYDISICLLAIALRTGRNTTPLLELCIDCLQDHPFKADRKLMVSYKRRGSSTHLTALRAFIAVP